MSFQPPTAASLRSTDPPAPFIEVTWEPGESQPDEPVAFTPTTGQPDGTEIAFDPSKFSFVYDEDENLDGDMQLDAVYLRCNQCDDWEFTPDNGESLYDVIAAAYAHQQHEHR